MGRVKCVRKEISFEIKMPVKNWHIYQYIQYIYMYISHGATIHWGIDLVSRLQASLTLDRDGRSIRLGRGDVRSARSVPQQLFFRLALSLQISCYLNSSRYWFGTDPIPAENISPTGDRRPTSTASCSMPSCPWSHGRCGQKSFKLVWRCHQLLSGFLAKGHLPRVASVTSVANYKDDNEMILGAVYRSYNLGRPPVVWF